MVQQFSYPAVARKTERPRAFLDERQLRPLLPRPASHAELNYESWTGIVKTVSHSTQYTLVTFDAKTSFRGSSGTLLKGSEKG
ncbi:242_t:CDS:2 [Paraglomus brasilianum]|uniref:242_t:CDS:1 n=1 Tax=Paraglomus brasilianum TaxID=144538 RepID=A0A9N9FIM0_9GLOM|nr:242_t:CDS:2 [Paraglomus brasilianum]